MCRGRLAISGSVVYSSRTKPVKALPPRRSRRKPRMPDARAGHLDPCRGLLGTARREAPRAAGGIGHLDGRHLDALDLRVAREERLGEEQAVGLQVVASKRHRLALDEVLHRVGGDQPGVVARRVRRPEGVAVDQHLHGGAEHGAGAVGRPAVALQAIRRDVALAVVVPLPAARECVHARPVRVPALMRPRLATRDRARKGTAALVRLWRRDGERVRVTSTC